MKIILFYFILFYFSGFCVAAGDLGYASSLRNLDESSGDRPSVVFNRNFSYPSILNCVWTRAMPDTVDDLSIEEKVRFVEKTPCRSDFSSGSSISSSSDEEDTRPCVGEQSPRFTQSESDLLFKVSSEYGEYNKERRHSAPF